MSHEGKYLKTQNNESLNIQTCLISWPSKGGGAAAGGEGGGVGVRG